VQLKHLPKVENTRARFARQSEHGLVNGWVVGERDFRIVLESEGDLELEPGEELFGEVLLYKWKLLMRSKVLRSMVVEQGDTKSVVVMDPLNYRIQKSDQRARFRKMDSTALLQDSHSVSCRVVDISVDGLGLVVGTELPIGERLHLEIRESGELYDLKGEVRYTSTLAKGYRTGLLLTHEDRVMQRKWEQFIAEYNRRLRLAA
jgi:hypothetical protein